MNNQNNLQITSPYKPLNDQNNLQVDISGGRVIIQSPTDGQTDFPQGGLYQWAFSLNNNVFRVEVATDSGFNNIVQTADVSAKELASSVAVGTGYYIRVSALEIINPSGLEITGVTLNTSTTEVQEGNDVIILGEVQGNGDYKTAGTWTRESGDAIPFTVLGNEITISGNTETNSAVFRFKSVQDPAYFVDRTITVTAASTVTQVDSLQGDRDSIQLMYDNLGGANWTNSWNTTTIQSGDLSTLYGVDTDANGRVTELDLRKNNLQGQIPEFPGLQNMWRFYVSQQDNANPIADDALDRITGPLPDSLGHTSCTHMMLSSNKSSIDIETRSITGVNKKDGQAANKYSGGIPTSWQNLTLEYLDISGQSTDWNFNGRLEPWMSNWNIKRIICHGDRWRGNNGGWSGGITKTAVGAWADCELIYANDNEWEFCELDAFTGWNNISRVYDFSTENNNPKSTTRDLKRWNHQLPDLSSNTLARRVNFGNRKLNGPYPAFLHNFTNLNEVLLSFMDFEYTEEYFPSFELMVGTTSRIRYNDLGDGVQSKLFRENENVSGYFSNRIINFYVMRSPNITGNGLPEGMHEWYELRYIRENACDYYGPLPSQPPGLHSSSMSGVIAHSNRFYGPYPASWGQMGTAPGVKFGGVITTGTITAVGPEYIEDSNANFAVDEFVIPNSGGPLVKKEGQVRGDGKEPRWNIISNTATRINYEQSGQFSGDVQFQVGDTYEIVRNGNDDDRTLRDISFSGCDLTGLLELEAFPTNMGAGGSGWTLSNNRFRMKDIAPNCEAFQSMADTRGCNWNYAPQKPFGTATAFNRNVGGNVEFNFSDQDYTGNVYQWFKDGTPITGETSHTLNLTNLQTSDSGEYTLEITNTKAPDLTSISNNQTLNVT